MLVDMRMQRERSAASNPLHFLAELVAGRLLVGHADRAVVLGALDLGRAFPADRLEIEDRNLVHDRDQQMAADHHCGKQDHGGPLPEE